MDLYINVMCVCVWIIYIYVTVVRSMAAKHKMCEAIARQPSSAQPASKQRANGIKFYGIINLKCSLTWIKYTAEVIC